MGCLEAAEKQNDSSIANPGPIKDHLCLHALPSSEDEDEWIPIFVGSI